MNFINSFKDEYQFLSNFYYVRVRLDGVVYPSVENAYQAAKSTDPDERQKFQIVSPAEAKMLSKNLKRTDNWDRYVSQ